MTPEDFIFISQLVRRCSGVVVGAEKTYLVETRLAPIVRELKVASISDIVLRLRSGDGDLQKRVVEAMTTNETLFFRDRMPFVHFEGIILPQLMGARPRGGAIRIWCAACSSGQEPYSLAMTLDELGMAAKGWDFTILATDISEPMINKAREGLYSQFEVQRGLPVKSLIRHFTQEGQDWRIAPHLRQRVTFKTLNLLEDFSSLGGFDVIFCRNVLIYFDAATKADLMNRLARALRIDGMMSLGSAETPYGFTTALSRHADEPSLLVRAESPLAAPTPVVPNLRRIQTG